MTPELTYRPLGPWNEPITDPRKSSGVFSGKVDEGGQHKITRPVAYWRTEQDLRREAEHLGADRVVVEIDVRLDQLRADGSGPKANARIEFPGVVVRLEGTRSGDLRYVCDAFDAQWSGDMPGWQANVRAVAKVLEALRVPERYGIGMRGEQYVGWAALGAGTPMGTAGPREQMTREHAAAVLAGGTDGTVTPADVLAELEDARMAYRITSKRYHPDRGGSHEVMAQVAEAWAIIEKHHRVGS